MLIFLGVDMAAVGFLRMAELPGFVQDVVEGDWCF
jgi:hypothetical protein